MLFFELLNFMSQKDDHAYMRILSHDLNFLANVCLSLFSSLSSAFFAHLLSKFVKFLASICRVAANINNFIDSFERVSTQFFLSNID